MCHVFVAQPGARAGLVLDDELLAQALAQLFGQDAGRDVVGAAGPVGRDHPHRPVGPGGRVLRMSTEVTGECARQHAGLDEEASSARHLECLR